jgi:hypothetical protein
MCSRFVSDQSPETVRRASPTQHAVRLVIVVLIMSSDPRGKVSGATLKLA